MKNLFTFLSAILFTTFVFAQAPQKMSYQAVIHNSSNNLVTNQLVGMKISILQGSTSGTAIYVETQTPITNNNGLVSIEIGGGTVTTGSFSSINWANGPYFIKTETDPSGSTTYNISGTTQLLSVPYALYAETSGTNVKMDSLMKVISKLEKMLQIGGGYYIQDYEGNEYKTMKIGNQLWMAENIYSKKDSTGKSIDGIFVYNNDESSIATYGLLN